MDVFTVGESARLAHVSVRALHHYDAIGLVRPSARSESGYRLYSGEDLERLRRVRFYRELEFGLGQIAEMLDDSDARADEHLRRQHRLLRERRDRDLELLEAIEREMEARKMGIELTPEEQFEVFGHRRSAEYAEEAERRWGSTEAWRQSQRRTAAYTKDDWIEIKAEVARNLTALIAAFETGEPAAGAKAMALAEEHRQHISRRFYECSPALHRGLAEMYIADSRFAAHYEEQASGLAGYLHDAILANAERLRHSPADRAATLSAIRRWRRATS